MELFEKYLSYWPLLAPALVFLALGLWCRVAAVRAAELAPKPLGWVKRYRGAGFPLRRDLPDKPRLRWWALLLILLLGGGLAAGRLAVSGTVFLRDPGYYFGLHYGQASIILCALGAGAVYCLLITLFDSLWTALLGALLFAASAAAGHSEGCLLAVSLLLLLWYLRAEKPGFPTELLYLAAVLALAPLIALRPALAWLLPCFPAAHWYKLVAQRRRQRLSGGQLALTLAAALLVWAAAALLAGALRWYLMLGFRTDALEVLYHPAFLFPALRALAHDLIRDLLLAPTPGMALDLMADAPLFGLGLWGSLSAWRLLRPRRDARGALILAVLAALLAVWLLSRRYALSLGLTLAAACVLREAELGKHRAPVLLLVLAGLAWSLGIQLAACFTRLAPGILERVIL